MKNWMLSLTRGDLFGVAFTLGVLFGAALTAALIIWGQASV